MTTVLYLLIVIFTVIQSASAKKYASFSSDSLNLNIIKAFVATICMALLAVGKIQLDGFTAIIGCLYGIMLRGSMHFGFLALSCGPLALTSMLVSLSVIIPVLYGVICCNEAMTATKLIGLILLCVILVVSRMGKQEKGNGVSTKWALCPFDFRHQRCLLGFTKSIPNIFCREGHGRVHAVCDGYCIYGFYYRGCQKWS